MFSKSSNASAENVDCAVTQKNYSNTQPIFERVDGVASRKPEAVFELVI